MQAKGLNSIVKTLYAILILIGCSTDPKDNPLASPSIDSGLMQKENLVALLKDVYIAEAAYKTKVVIHQVNEDVLVENYSTIFADHGITAEEFKESYTWWWEHPAAMKSVLQEVTERLNELEHSDDYKIESK